MKLSLMLGWLGVPLLAMAGDVQRGAAYTNVIAELGEPSGEIQAGSYRILYYDRGKVELRSNVVTKLELVSAEQLERQRLLREKQQAEAARREAEARTQRIAEGTTVRQNRLADASFLGQAAAERVAYWQLFKRQYPEVPLGDEYTTALKELEQEYAAQRVAQARQQEVDDLRDRAEAAEQRARRAEQRHSTVIYYPPAIYGWPAACDYRPPYAVSTGSEPFIRYNHQAGYSRIGTAVQPSRIGTTTYPPYLRANTTITFGSGR